MQEGKTFIPLAQLCFPHTHKEALSEILAERSNLITAGNSVQD